MMAHALRCSSPCSATKSTGLASRNVLCAPRSTAASAPSTSILMRSGTGKTRAVEAYRWNHQRRARIVAQPILAHPTIARHWQQFALFPDGGLHHADIVELIQAYIID